MDAYSFVTRWSKSKLREQQAAQSHFIELCHLIGHPTPTEYDPEGTRFTFEEHVRKATGGRGRADVWLKGRFAWEYKGKHKDLDAAYYQLLSYRGALENPPLLIACDFDEYRIYPQFPNTSGEPFKFFNNDLLDEKYRTWLKWSFTEPARFLEERQADLRQRELLTKELADEFAHLADLLRNYKVGGKTVWTPLQIARFLTRVVFVLFSEDIELLPMIDQSSAFRYILDSALESPDQFVPGLQSLFEAMDGRLPAFMMKRVPYFNGGLFSPAPDESGRVEVLDITPIPGTLAVLRKASAANWRKVNPTLFGTMFEGALDPAKRAQLGAHYTSETDIRLVLEPVLMLPLNRAWECARTEAEPLMQQFLRTDLPPREKYEAREKLEPIYERMMEKLETTTVLDPACGSGNFLYMSLRLMKDLEARIKTFFAPLELPPRDVVTPRQLYGIEKDEFAANLARVVVWIGYLQWRGENEENLLDNLPSPILRDKLTPDEPDRIQCADAILRYDEDGKPYEPKWVPAKVIVGNPPFLGGNRIRQELGSYVEDLFALYEGRIPAFADLVCYWFEKARAHLEARKVQRCGLLATNSIRGGANREVLKRVKQTGDIFMAWSDRKWVLDGAAVRVSIVGFDDGSEEEKYLDGTATVSIAPDLRSHLDLTTVKILDENAGLCYMGPSPKAPFDIPESMAQAMLLAQNPSGRNNLEVVRPVASAIDLVGRHRNVWTIDFGLMSLDEAKLYEQPFSYVLQNVFPVRSKNCRASYAEKWWQYAEARPGLRRAIAGMQRFIVTPTIAKHRIFVWGNERVLYNQQVITFAREDDYFFGVLHSYAHELWSLRQGTWLGKGNDPRYTPTTTFETFPLPFPPGREDLEAPVYQTITAAAKALHKEREVWLCPPHLMELGADAKLLKERTLTKLYNAAAEYRQSEIKTTSKENAAIAFAPRLVELHDVLDRAVLSAYGWGDLCGQLRTPDGDEELLRRLLTLNMERAAAPHN